MVAIRNSRGLDRTLFVHGGQPSWADNTFGMFHGNIAPSASPRARTTRMAVDGVVSRMFIAILTNTSIADGSVINLNRMPASTLDTPTQINAEIIFDQAVGLFSDLTSRDSITALQGVCAHYQAGTPAATISTVNVGILYTL